MPSKHQSKLTFPELITCN